MTSDAAVCKSIFVYFLLLIPCYAQTQEDSSEVAKFAITIPADARVFVPLGDSIQALQSPGRDHRDHRDHRDSGYRGRLSPHCTEGHPVVLFGILSLT